MRNYMSTTNHPLSVIFVTKLLYWKWTWTSTRKPIMYCIPVTHVERRLNGNSQFFLTKNMLTATTTSARSFNVTVVRKTLKFKTKALLKQHELSHTDSRPFLCEVCGHGFKTKQQLKRHRGTRRCKVSYGEPCDIWTSSENTIWLCTYSTWPV